MAPAFARHHRRAVGPEIGYNKRNLSQLLHLPVMAADGERFSVAAVADNLRHRTSDVRHDAFADCGHHVAEERSDELASLLLSFFDGR